jgi:hypothetical protein
MQGDPPFLSEAEVQNRRDRGHRHSLASWITN